MTRLTRLCRAVGVAAVVAAATLSTTQAAYAGPDGPTLPPGTEGIAVPAGNKVFLVGHATGVQTYKCNAGQLATTGSVPTADLVGNNDKNVIIKHSAGPTWTATDGSTAIKDPAVNNVLAPSPTGSIPWLLLTTKGAAGPNGDRLAGTTFIQRVNTTGGVSPGGACTGDLSVPYTADYYFYKATGKPGA
jgi:hypothetical protein